MIIMEKQKENAHRLPHVVNRHQYAGYFSLMMNNLAVCTINKIPAQCALIVTYLLAGSIQVKLLCTRQ